QVGFRPAAADEESGRRMRLDEDASHPVVVKAAVEGGAGVEREGNLPARALGVRDQFRRDRLERRQRLQRRWTSRMRSLGFKRRLRCGWQIDEEILGPGRR